MKGFLLFLLCVAAALSIAFSADYTTVTFNLGISANTPWIVPSWVNNIEVKLYGQPGNNNYWYGSCTGGKGGYIHGYIGVVPGETLYVNVNVGGGTCSSCSGSLGGGNGGGASDIRQGGSDLTNRVAVAGGGGAANSVINGNNQCQQVNGGAGGGLVGAQASPQDSPASTGGTQTAGGTGMVAGGFGYGAPGCSSCKSGYDVMGGGGGWYGGGSSSSCRFGASGGSSYFVPAPKGTLLDNVQGGGQCNNAYVSITYITVAPSSRPTAQPTSQPFMNPTSHPTSQPSSQPSMEPSRQPTGLPSSQPSLLPSANPTYGNYKPSHQSNSFVGEAYSNAYDESIHGYSASYSFTNVGHGDKYSMYLEVQVLNTQFNGGKSVNVATQIVTYDASGSKTKTNVNGQCELPYTYDSNVTSSSLCKQKSYYVICAINFPILSTYLSTPDGGTVTVNSFTTSVVSTNSSQASKCPLNGIYLLAAVYTLSYNHMVPTVSPTREPTFFSSNVLSNEVNVKIITVGKSQDTLPIIFGFALLFIVFGIVLIYFRRSDQRVTQHTFVYATVELMLLAAQLSSELVLIYVMITYKEDRIAFKAFAIILIAFRVSHLIPFLYILRKYTKDFMVEEHMADNSKLYAILNLFSSINIPMMRYLPWKVSKFTKNSEGMPNLHVFWIITWFSFSNTCCTTIFQVMFLVYANEQAALTESLATVYASVIFSMLLLLMNLCESIIINRRLKIIDKNSEKVDDISAGGKLDSKDSSTARGSSSDNHISLTVINPLSDVSDTSLPAAVSAPTAIATVYSESLESYVIKIRTYCEYSIESTFSETINMAARDLGIVEECTKQTGFLNKAKFICSSLGI